MGQGGLPSDRMAIRQTASDRPRAGKNSAFHAFSHTASGGTLPWRTCVGWLPEGRCCRRGCFLTSRLPVALAENLPARADLTADFIEVAPTRSRGIPCSLQSFFLFTHCPVGCWSVLGSYWKLTIGVDGRVAGSMVSDRVYLGLATFVDGIIIESVAIINGRPSAESRAMSAVRNWVKQWSRG